MLSKLKTCLMVCAVLLGLGLIMPVQDVSAATVTDQIRVDAQKKTVTVDFKSFSSAGYNYTVTSKTTPDIPVISETTASNIGDGDIEHLTFSTASLPADFYRVTITASDSETKITKNFHTFSGISNAVYTNANFLLKWTDTYSDTTQYRINFYKSANDVSNPAGFIGSRKYSKGNTPSFTIPASLSGSSYYVTITPFVKIKEGTSDVSYFGPSYAMNIAVIKAPSSVKVTAGYKSAVVKWSSVPGAASYVVKNLTTGDKFTVANTKTQLTVNGLTEKKAYKFCVYSKLGKSTSGRSTAVSVSIPATVTGKVSDLTVYGYNGYLYISWTGVSGADGYNVYYKKSSASSYTLLGSIASGTTYKTSKVKVNATCTFLVKPYTLINGSKIDKSAQNATVSGNPYKLLNEMATVRTIGYLSRTTRKTNLYNTYTSKTVAKSLSSGVKVEQLDAVNTKYNRCKVLYNNKTYYCNRDYIKSYASNYTTKHYSTAVKENFVKNYSSPTNYLIWISQYTQQVSIFKGSKGNWKMIRTFICATGKHTTRSARGQFKITNKEKGWYYSSTYEEYITHFYLRNSFHTRIHRYGGGYSDATIGKPASNGCVRLYDADAKYIYQNMPKSTTVVSY